MSNREEQREAGAKMQKAKKISVGVSFGILGSILVIFQNCGPTPQMEMASKGVDDTYNQAETTVDDHPDISPEKAIVQVQYEPVLADRTYVVELFRDIFGPTTDTVDSVRTYLNRVDYGGPCSMYEMYRIENARGEIANSNGISTAACAFDPSPTALGADVNPKPTVTRQANLMKTCTDLVQNAGTLGFALKRISPSEAVPTASVENMQRLFNLFYRGKPAPDNQLIGSLQLMMDPALKTAANWQLPIYTVCVSSHWQEL